MTTHRTIRFSEIQRFKQCRRSWMNGYHLGLRPRPQAPSGGMPEPRHALEVGTAVDRALREFYLYDTPVRETVARLKAEAAAAAAPAALTPAWSEVFDLADRMVAGYVNWLEEEGADAGERTIGCEIALALPLRIGGDTVDLTIHIDRVLLDTTWDQFVLEDTKTVQNLTKTEEFQIDDQLLTYVFVWNSLFPDMPISRARHNMLRRVKRAASAKPPFYGRVELEFNEHQMANHAAHLDGVLTDMVTVMQALEAGKDPHSFCYPTPSRDCSWRCDFLPICAAHDDGSDLPGLRSALYVQGEN